VLPNRDCVNVSHIFEGYISYLYAKILFCILVNILNENLVFKLSDLVMAVHHSWACEIWQGMSTVCAVRMWDLSFHGGGDDNVVLLGYGACRLFGRWQRFGETYCIHLQPWRWNMSPYSALKMETVCFSETLVSTVESTRAKTQKNNTIMCRTKMPSKNSYYFRQYFSYFYGYSYGYIIASQVIIKQNQK
jgi:hypothetical protein